MDGVLALPFEDTLAGADDYIERVFRAQAAPLVRLARIFVDDVDAAEDLVQEAFLRLRGSLHKIRDDHKALAYLRSIVLNLARDHNRRGLVSLRHRARARTDVDLSSVDDGLLGEEDQREVIEAVKALPRRQRDCIVLRYYVELSPGEIAETLGLSLNSVKTHLQRGLRTLEQKLEAGR